jgi:hypothetical protein
MDNYISFSEYQIKHSNENYKCYIEYLQKQDNEIQQKRFIVLVLVITIIINLIIYYTFFNYK